MKRDTNGKPLIRHCRNCKWHKYNNSSPFGKRDCRVRYKDVICERLRALICKYYEGKEQP